VLESSATGWNAVIINIGNRNGVGNLPYSNVGTPLARSAKLRQAFEEAIDRDTLIRIAYDGLAQRSCTPVPPANTVWYAAIKVPCTPYDPKHAKKLVAESGIPNPTVHLLASGTLSLRVAQVIQEMERAVGINVVIDPVAGGTLAISMTGNFDAALRGLPNAHDPDRSIYRYLATSGTTNVSGYSSPRLDLILANGLKATEFKARSTLYRAAQQIIHDERPMIFLATPIIVSAFSANLTGVGFSNDVLLVANARFT
jgi:peptide/nickel transport system substrate-binding protein